MTVLYNPSQAEFTYRVYCAAHILHSNKQKPRAAQQVCVYAGRAHPYSDITYKTGQISSRRQLLLLLH